MENRAESICKIGTVNIWHVVHFGVSFGTNVKSPDMGLEKRTQGALGANCEAFSSIIGLGQHLLSLCVLLLVFWELFVLLAS